MNDYMAGLPQIDFIEPERGVRQSVRIATEDDVQSTETVTVSPCGGRNAEVDQDGDGDVDWCRNLGGTTFNGTCPSLLVAVDRDGDGSLDRCVARIRPEGAIDPALTTTTVADGEAEDGEAEDGEAEDGEGGDGDGAAPTEQDVDGDEVVSDPDPANESPTTTQPSEPTEAPAEPEAPAPTAAPLPEENAPDDLATGQ